MSELNVLLEQMDGLKDMEAKLKLELKNVEKEQSKIEVQLTKVLSETDQDYIESGIYSFVNFGGIPQARQNLPQSKTPIKQTEKYRSHHCG